MYEERREKFSFKSFFLTILLVLLFVFLMLWLFPTKWDVKDLQSTYDIERLQVLYDEIFALYNLLAACRCSSTSVIESCSVLKFSLAFKSG